MTSYKLFSGVLFQQLICNSYGKMLMNSQEVEYDELLGDIKFSISNTWLLTTNQKMLCIELLYAEIMIYIYGMVMRDIWRLINLKKIIFPEGNAGGESVLFSSPELKAQVSSSDGLSVCQSVCPGNIFVFFSRTTGTISIKRGTKHPWLNGIQAYSNKGQRPFPRGDNNQIAKIQRQN